VLDRWLLQVFVLNVFSVKGAYQSLTHVQEKVEPVLNSVELIWNKVVPVMVLVFAWRFMENQILTRDNLFKRSILNIDAQHCVLGCSSNKRCRIFSLFVI
jgi:hypothetical protein